jgi:hypothetical protein
MTSKRVKFNCIHDIWIIPNKEDIFENGLNHELWWTEDECIMIRKIASDEFEKTLKFNKTKNRKLIYKTMWYQLDFDEIYKILKTYK